MNIGIENWRVSWFSKRMDLYENNEPELNARNLFEVLVYCRVEIDKI